MEAVVQPQEAPTMRPAPGAELVALFDGDCAVCTATAEFIWARDLTGRVECVDLQQPEQAVRFPDFTTNAVRAQLHAVDAEGRVFIGVDALREVGRRLPRWWAVAWILGVPGIRTVAQWAYVSFAKRRLFFNRFLPKRTMSECAGDTCAVDWAALEDAKQP